MLHRRRSKSDRFPPVLNTWTGVNFSSPAANLRFKGQLTRLGVKLINYAKFRYLNGAVRLD